ncbi:acetyltransferase [Chryseobacterium angstadtii]|uniref:Acetyltransferase n=1 Tax=Chryseobacterium angstadtii TaxID=558151 RepID=A0A0J7IHJ9_9FLAO|nr:NeuD/PglB/VioB family sugar acetyltransferase [Chryseobacterium angstadtii]KMQ65557.1 acetyltransferase [Chryseobacterium angstadtii]
MKKIAIIGAGGFGREVKMLIDHINQKERQFELIGFYDDKHYDHPINGIPYLGKIEKINDVEESLCIAVAIGDPKTKKKIIQSIINSNIEFPNLVHPSVIIGQDNVKFGKGNIICAGVIITIDIEIEDFVILNLSCTVGHDTRIKKYSSFMPTVNISGEVVINEAVYVGTGAKIINLLEIGENTIVGAGAVVYKSLPANCTAVGIPAKPIKFND